MQLTIVVAASENNAIGKDNQLLWHLPEDLKWLKNNSWGMPIVMGRNSFISLGNKALKGRVNLVLTHNKKFKADDAVTVRSMKDARFFCTENGYNELLIFGGAQVYKDTLDDATKIILTRVHHVFEDADAFFPAIDESKWKLVSNKDCYKDEKHAYDYSFQVWERK